MRLLLAHAVLLTALHAVYIRSLTSHHLARLQAQPSLLFVTVRWCSHCNTLQSQIAHLAYAVRDSRNLLIAHCDADDEPDIAARFNVTAFPHILYFPPAFNINHRSISPHIYADWHWAEVIAEFINNATGTVTVDLEPRDQFLRWRSRNPWNRGAAAIEELHDHSLVYDDGISRLGPRHPHQLTSSNFQVALDPAVRFLVLFYDQGDSFLKHLKVQWQQASSAFSGAENVTIAFADTTHDQLLAAIFVIRDTPACRYFPRCVDANKCQPLQCQHDMDELENIIQFISDRVMVEMGIFPNETEKSAETNYDVTKEDYQTKRQRGFAAANYYEYGYDTVKTILKQHHGERESAEKQEL